MSSSSQIIHKYLSFGVCQLNAGSKEDTFTAISSHASDGADNISSFSVYDGHNGVRNFLLTKIFLIFYF